MLLNDASLEELAGVFGTARLEIDKPSNGTVLLQRESADSGGATLEFLKRRSGWGVLSDGDRIGTLAFAGADSVDAAVAAQIHVDVDGTPGSNDMPGRITFATTPDGSGATVERMRLTSAGRLGIGNATPQALLHAGAGIDTPSTTPTIYASEAGATHIVARNSADNVEGRLSAGVGSLALSCVTNHDLLFATNDTTRGRFTAGGRFGVDTVSPLGAAHIAQASTTAAISVLALEQADLSEEFIEFTATIGTGNPIEAIGAKALTTTHFIRISLNGSFRYIPVGTIA